MCEVKHAGELRLLYLINGLGPGGAERSLAELLPFYMAEGIRPLIVCLRRHERGVESLIRRLGCEVRFLPAGGLASRLQALRRTIRDHGVRLVHTTLFDADVLGRLAAVRTGAPVLTSLVNTSYDPVRFRDPNVRPYRLRVVRAVDGWTARRFTSHFHAITEAVKESCAAALRIPRGRITVIERGRDRRRLGFPGSGRRHEARRRLGIGENDEVVVHVGRQEFQKGHACLLQAAAILAGTRPRLVVLLCGREGHATRQLRELAGRLRLGDRLRFLGHRDDVPEILAAADVFAFPSVYEGLGGAAIEAMALGLPVVASDLASLREVVEHGGNGFLVEPGSPGPLAAALGRVLDDRSLAARFGARSLRIFQERFTIERSAARMIALYREVAFRDRAPARQGKPVRARPS